MNETNRIINYGAVNLPESIGSGSSEQSLLGKLGAKFSNIVSGVSSAVLPQIADVTEFGSLIDKQIYWQMQMQTYTAESNIEKSRHEVLMSPIRNLRVA